MAKNEQPEQEVTLNMQQLVELVKSMAASQSLDASAISTIAAQAATEASKSLREQWWNEATFPNKSAFNPEGDYFNKRPVLHGDIYWAGYLLRGDELTRAEIDLVNQLRPGDYEVMPRGGGEPLPFKVRDLDPGSRNTRRLLVLFPCADPDQRHNLGSMTEMLQQVVAPVAA